MIRPDHRTQFILYVFYGAHYRGWSRPRQAVDVILAWNCVVIYVLCKPSSKIFYWPFQGGTSFVDLLCFCSVLCLLCLCARLFICALWSPAGKGLTSWLSFVVSTVSLSLSHWYPGSGVVLDCIDSWSLHPYLLVLFCWKMPGPLFSTKWLTILCA